ncbi:MAG TPA: T9SS type A sorting domain-containing protein [Puia sp.]|nr:T9SS type A sorting domain-containing protein [Puia sp.]
MKPVYPAAKIRDYISNLVITAFLAIYATTASAQSCPMNANPNISTYPNTYFPSTATVNAGATSITLGAVNYGSTPISSGDILLIIQMQGAQIKSSNNSSYGANNSTGSGYRSNTSLLAGNMEYVVATNSVPLTGGTLNLLHGLTNKYQNSPFGTDGQYTYQIIRVPVYYDVTLTGNITAPRWDGASGGVVVLYAIDNINMAGYTIDASGLGFRGGGGRAFTGSGSGSSSDYITSASSNANGGKGEGIAGMPKYLNNNNSFLDVSTYEGYPNGSYAKGAPGNAGGGGTDGNPASNNDENTGGGGGANGGAGGNGGNSWSSNIACGGRAGSTFDEVSPSRLVMGGGGGAGTTNNATGSPGNGFASSGSAGGGIIILIANNTITGTGTIKANGANANSTVKNDGSGGAGAGGSIIVFSKNGNLNNITVTAKGGIGGSNQLTTVDPHGPGGGGGGGVIYSNKTLNASSSVAGGIAGLTNKGTSNYGATAGSTGILTQNIIQSQMPSFPLTCVTLSVDFISVAAAQKDGITTVNWQVSNEPSSTKEYIVERSVNGVDYSDIAHFAYHPSFSSVNMYEYADNDNTAGAGAGTVYYRIKAVNVSGSGQYSKTVTVLMNELTARLTVFPNPAKNSATISLVASGSGDVSLRLFDLKGSTVWQKQTRVAAGANAILLDQLENIPNGIYILQWFDGLKPQQVKLIVNH